MGWLWADKPTQTSPSSLAPEKAPSQSERQGPPSTSTPSPQSPSLISAIRPSVNEALQEAPKKSKPLTRDEEADLELAKFIEELNYEPSSSGLEAPRPLRPFSSPFSRSATTTAPPDPNSTSPAPTPGSFDPSTLPPSLVYPTAMSCRAAFDAAYHCQLPGGQFVNVYRYGSLRDCTELWSQFWFCMRTNRGYMTEQDRERKIWEHYKKRADAKYGADAGDASAGDVEGKSGRGLGRSGGFRSSEEVWEGRREKVVGAFKGDLMAALREKENEADMLK